MLLPGSVYCTGVFGTYIQSYYRIPKDKTYVQDLLPVIIGIQMFMMPLGSHLTQKNVNPRLLTTIGAAVMFPFFMIATLFDGEDQFLGFSIFYCLGWAFNQAMAYMVPIHHCWLWWPNNPGLVSGIILGGFGFGALIFDNVFTHIINPSNEPADSDGFYKKDVDDRFMSTWRTVVGMWFGVYVLGTALIFSGPAKPDKRSARVITDNQYD